MACKTTCKTMVTLPFTN